MEHVKNATLLVAAVNDRYRIYIQGHDYSNKNDDSNNGGPALAAGHETI